ncbi:MAG: hypothetical protein IK092_00590 [Muribaculaceae bacterium]|nr:hypothetical protein [Muribaculaceae bacterium]
MGSLRLSQFEVSLGKKNIVNVFFIMALVVEVVLITKWLILMLSPSEGFNNINNILNYFLVPVFYVSIIVLIASMIGQFKSLHKPALVILLIVLLVFEVLYFILDVVYFIPHEYKTYEVLSVISTILLISRLALELAIGIVMVSILRKRLMVAGILFIVSAVLGAIWLIPTGYSTGIVIVKQMLSFIGTICLLVALWIGYVRIKEDY